ncbi:deoxyribodipyrimidine photolyase [bacterium CG2_30_54_10]|nr:MAG: deoxyribodipyrimidine photolyase [bacterium CG2_30_54_10]
MIGTGDPTRRARFLAEGRVRKGPVLYLMSRDQRVEDNWALIYAQAQALAREVPLVVAFIVDPELPGATLRAWDFLLKGLFEIEAALKEHAVPFFALFGNPVSTILQFVEKYNIGFVVTDFSPLRHERNLLFEFEEASSVPLVEVDAHNVVPAWIASPKQEFAARTFRPKLNRQLSDFLEEFPPLVTMRHTAMVPPPIDWDALRRSLRADPSVPPVNWLVPGEEAGRALMAGFLAGGIRTYRQTRNNPTLDGTSNFSPYLHFGQISAQRIALSISTAEVSEDSRLAFLEELIVRRELSDNFCLYNPKYDSPDGYPDWSRKTLTLHENDRREYLYDRAAFEQASTHDDLWNAAQRQMIRTGKMHGYLRMYWAKKILEWSSSPAEAHRIALYLNDRYELDGRDPNGYTGVAWSIGGVHDRPWGIRPVFGSIRFMNFKACKSKFKVAKFIERWRE